MIAAYGWGLVRPDEPTDSSTHTLPAPTPEASFRRVGYETWWRLPVSDNMLLNIRHAGLWNHPDGANGDFHTLWNLALEVDMGEVTYLVGYQKGSAAPLFVPIETTRAGLSFAVGGGTAGSGGRTRIEEEEGGAMLDHPVVDVALGLALLYSVLSLVASVVKEWVSTLLSLRAKNLRKGIQTLIGDDYAQRLYGHPLVSTLAKDKKKPSYIGAETFASALVDLLAQDEDGNPVVAMGDDAAKLVDRVGVDSALKPPLRALTNLGAETVDDLRRQVADWFDEGMNRVSGWYRRQTQLIIFAIGAVVAVSANASTVHVVQGPLAG